ncbi:MAG: B12-binding domain-containing radical SAM protein [Patescibacteria group bacterium]
MRILLFYPPITVRGDDPTVPGIAPPLGLASLAAFLENKGHDVVIIDALAEGFNERKRGKNFLRVGLTAKEIVCRINYYKPDIVGVSTMFTAFAPDAHELAALVKKISPKISVVFGGAHASTMPQGVLQDKNVDIVVIGEGEETLLEIVERLANKKGLDDIPGTAVRGAGGKVIINHPRPFISDLDSLPLPARHLLPMDIYLRYDKNEEGSYIMRSPFTSMFTSRGCPNNCIYCAVPGIWGRRWRPWSAERVLQEIEHLVKRYGIKEIHFLDDNISVSRERLEKICDGLLKRKIDIKWTTPNGIAIWSLDKPLLLKMKKSGCYRLTFGIESGHPETQKFIRKNLNLEKAKEVMKIASNLGLWTFSTYIIGFPYETKEAMDQTFDYAINSYSDFVGFILLMPFPGTDVTKIMVNEGLIKEADFKKTKIAALFSGYKGAATKYFTPLELKHAQSQAHKRLMFSRLLWPITRPATLLRKIQSFEDLKYAIRITKNYLYMFILTIKLGEFKTHRIREAVNLGLKGVESEKQN